MRLERNDPHSLKETGMLNLVATDPRFLPVTLNGKTYITSTLLHKQKREGGMTKYERHGDFLEMVRKIDCYDRLEVNGDIIEVSKNSVKSTNGKMPSDEIVELFSSLLKANYGNPLLLISPTAQKEIEHHLDDEASKDSAVKSSAVSATLDGGYGMDAAQTLLKHFQDPRNLAGVFTQLAEATEKVKELETQLPQLEAERDHAIKTKAFISDKKTATALVKLGNLVQYMKKRGIPVPPYAEINSEEDYSERVQELEKLVKKLDTALEEYRRKENLQEEENQTYHPTSKNGIGINDALRKWGLSLTTTNSREINASIRSYLINIGGEILWADSTFKGAPSKRCLWHPQFLDENKGRILNFLTNEGWLKKA
jgi:hypothetical protein